VKPQEVQTVEVKQFNATISTKEVDVTTPTTVQTIDIKSEVKEINVTQNVSQQVVDIQ